MALAGTSLPTGHHTRVAVGIWRLHITLMRNIITSALLFFVGAHVQPTRAQTGASSPPRRVETEQTALLRSKRAAEPITPNSVRDRWRRRSEAIRSGGGREQFRRAGVTNIPAPPPPTSTPPPGETKNSEPAGDEPVRSETPAAPPSSSSQTNTVHQAGEGLHAASAPAVAGETSSRSSLDKNAGESARAAVADPTSIYRVGVGDVLHIRLLNPPANSLAARPSLYTV